MFDPVSAASEQDLLMLSIYAMVLAIIACLFTFWKRGFSFDPNLGVGITFVLSFVTGWLIRNVFDDNSAMIWSYVLTFFTAFVASLCMSNYIVKIVNKKVWQLILIALWLILVYFIGAPIIIGLLLVLIICWLLNRGKNK